MPRSDRSGPTSTSAYPTDIPETEPEKITYLWSLVRTDRARRLRVMAHNHFNLIFNAASEPTESYADTEDRDDDSSRRPRRRSARVPQPGTKRFLELMLQPRGIHISTHHSYPSIDAFRHFQVDVTLTRGTTAREFYAARNVVLSSSPTLWLDAHDSEAIQDTRLEYLQHAQEPPPPPPQRELSYLAIALDRFFRAERPRQPAPSPFETSLLVKRHLGQDFTPGSATDENDPKRRWLAPPPLLPDEDCTEDMPAVAPPISVSPDISYWLWHGRTPGTATRADDLTSDDLQPHVYVSTNGFCPYLSVAVKSSEAELARGEHELAGAGAIALYNRWRLHAEATTAEQQQQQHPGESDGDLDLCLRHYAIVIAGPCFVVFCLTPRTTRDRGWAGCRTTRLSGGRLVDDRTVRKLVHWVNEIHAWAKTAYADAAARDVQQLVDRAEQGGGLVAVAAGDVLARRMRRQLRLTAGEEGNGA